ncbi:dihydrofolate reductase [Candidatus Pacearchaeota archaeon]|nr:dihydrofolate reductase [Candidatus Pacearchaeota archaeon]
MDREIILIAAVAYDNVIGNNGSIPWWDDTKLRREDMSRFRRLTLDKPVIMGHTTFLSIGKVLPRRVNFVLSRKGGLSVHGANICPDLNTAILAAHALSNEAYIIGGEQIFYQAIGDATRLEMTEIDGRYEGDTFFPRYKDTGKWYKTFNEEREGYRFSTYRRSMPK